MGILITQIINAPNAALSGEKPAMLGACMGMVALIGMSLIPENKAENWGQVTDSSNIPKSVFEKALRLLLADGRFSPHENKPISLKVPLTVERSLHYLIDAVLSTCDSFEMIFYPVNGLSDIDDSGSLDALTLYDTNRNGRITCSEARAHGIAPVSSEHPAYEHMNDSDGDGTVCE